MKLRLRLLIFLFVGLLSFGQIHAFDFNTLNVDSLFMSVVEIDDQQEERIHYEKNSDAKMYPASMTKMMSTYVALQYLDDYEATVTITASDLAGLSAQGASVAGLSLGEVVTIDDLLYGALLSSGADATRAIARIVSGSEEEYINLMNQQAKKLGMLDTNFVNTSGLHDENHYSTTHDLVILMKESLKIPKLKELMTTESYTTKPTNLHPYGLEFNNTLGMYSEISQHDIGYILGGKTGWTPEAGYCLLSFSEFQGKTVIIASGGGFNYGDQLKDHNLVFEALFESLHTVTPVEAQTILGAVPIQFGKDLSTFDLVLQEDVVVDIPYIISKDDLEIIVTHPEIVEAQVDSGTEMGRLDIVYHDQSLLTEEILFMNEEIILRNDFAYYLSEFQAWASQIVVIYTGAAIVLAVVVVLLIWYLYKRVRHRSHQFQSRRRKRNQWRL